MKSLYTLTLILLFPVFLHAQQSIAGSWEVSLSESLKRMRQDMKAKYDTLPAQVQQNISESFSNRIFTFENNGTVKVQWRSNNTLRQLDGKWVYESSLKKLTIETGEKQQREYEVTWVTSTVLILKMKEDGGIFHELYLKRKS